jgi:hypothetical protein
MTVDKEEEEAVTITLVHLTVEEAGYVTNTHHSGMQKRELRKRGLNRTVPLSLWRNHGRVLNILEKLHGMHKGCTWIKKMPTLLGCIFSM